MAIPLYRWSDSTPQFRRHLASATSDDRGAFRNFLPKGPRLTAPSLCVVLGQYSRLVSEPPRSLRMKLSSENLQTTQSG